MQRRGLAYLHFGPAAHHIVPVDEFVVLEAGTARRERLEAQDRDGAVGLVPRTGRACAPGAVRHCTYCAGNACG